MVALHLDHGQACVQVFFIRAHQSWGNRDFYPRTGAGAEEAEIMEAFLAQFYDSKDPPRLLLLSHRVEDPDLVQAASVRAGGAQGGDRRAAAGREGRAGRERRCGTRGKASPGG